MSNEHSTLDTLLLTLHVYIHNFTNDRAKKCQTNTVHSTHFCSHYMYISIISLTTGPKSVKRTQYTRHTSAHTTSICPCFHQRQGQKVSNKHSTFDSLMLTLQVYVHNFTNDRAKKYQTNTIHSTHFYSHYMYISRISLTTGPKSIKPTQYTRHTSAHSTCMCPSFH